MALAAAIAATGVAGAVTAKFFNELPLNRASLPTFVSRGAIGVGVQFLSVKIANWCVGYFVAPVNQSVGGDGARADRENNMVGLSSWIVSGIALSAITKVCMDRLGQPISAKELGVNLLLSGTINLLSGFAIGNPD